MRAPMNLVPPYDVMCLHRHISTSWLFSSLILFQPANENPTWSQSRGAGFWVVGGGGSEGSPVFVGGVGPHRCTVSKLQRLQQLAVTPGVVFLRLWTGCKGTGPTSPD